MSSHAADFNRTFDNSGSSFSAPRDVFGSSVSLLGDDGLGRSSYSKTTSFSTGGGGGLGGFSGSSRGPAGTSSFTNHREFERKFNSGGPSYSSGPQRTSSSSFKSSFQSSSGTAPARTTTFGTSSPLRGGSSSYTRSSNYSSNTTGSTRPAWTPPAGGGALNGNYRDLNMRSSPGFSSSFEAGRSSTGLGGGLGGSSSFGRSGGLGSSSFGGGFSRGSGLGGGSSFSSGLGSGGRSRDSASGPFKHTKETTTRTVSDGVNTISESKGLEEDSTGKRKEAHQRRIDGASHTFVKEKPDLTSGWRTKEDVSGISEYQKADFNRRFDEKVREFGVAR